MSHLSMKSFISFGQLIFTNMASTPSAFAIGLCEIDIEALVGPVGLRQAERLVISGRADPQLAPLF